MKIFASLAVATLAAGSALGFVQPASANPGPTADPTPLGAPLYAKWEYCRKFSYRVLHPECRRIYDESGYHRSDYDEDDRYDRDEYRHRHHRDHYDRDYDRDYDYDRDQGTVDDDDDD
jgi:hypothetical protein